MKICFITDLHIDKDGIFPFDTDTRSRFLKILKHIAQKHYDMLVIGGDLCNRTGDTEVYEWIKYHLDALNMPYYMISGNHDSSTLMAEVFNMKHLLTVNELFYHLSFLHVGDIYFLDTSPGTKSDIQYTWLEEKIRNQVDKDVIICMHHPPILSGSKHMEPQYFFRQSEKFLDMCLRFKDKRFIIFSGHYHMARTVLKDNITLFISPATSIQIDPNSAELIKDMVNFGYREIFMDHHTITMTNVVYLR